MSFPEFPAIPLVGYVRLPGGYPKKMSYENLTATLFNWVSQLFICSTQLLVEQVDVETGNLKMANWNKECYGKFWLPHTPWVVPFHKNSIVYESIPAKFNKNSKYILGACLSSGSQWMNMFFFLNVLWREPLLTFIIYSDPEFWLDPQYISMLYASFQPCIYLKNQISALGSLGCETVG